VTVYVSLEQVLELHRLLTRRFGGAAGLQDRGALEAAVARPRMTFGGEDLCPDVQATAAAMLQSLVMKGARHLVATAEPSPRAVKGNQKPSFRTSRASRRASAVSSCAAGDDADRHGLSACRPDPVWHVQGRDS